MTLWPGVLRNLSKQQCLGMKEADIGRISYDVSRWSLENYGCSVIEYFDSKLEEWKLNEMPICHL